MPPRNTHCIRGHERTPESYGLGGCRICQNERLKGKHGLKSRRATASDRNIGISLEALRIGHYQLIVSLEDGGAHIKPEGSLIMRIGNKRIIIVPQMAK